MNKNLNNGTSQIEEMNSKLVNSVSSLSSNVATEAGTKIANSIESAISAAQTRENIMFYGKIALGIAAVVGIGYIAYDKYFSDNEELIVVSDAAQL